MTQHILTEKQEGILTLRFNRPEKKNAVTLDMYRAMTSALQRAEEDEDLRIVFFCGSQDCFTSGNDIQDFIQHPPTGEDSPVLAFLKTLLNFKKILIASVNGIAIGLGTTMLLHFDLIYAGAGARFHFPFVKLGLCPEAGSTYLLPHLVGYQRAAELLLLAEPFSAQKARELGLVNEVYPPEELEELAFAKARQLADQAPKALLVTKRLLLNHKIPLARSAMEEESHQFLKLLYGPEAQEAFLAFMEKRKPNFFK